MAEKSAKKQSIRFYFLFFGILAVLLTVFAVIAFVRKEIVSGCLFVTGLLATVAGTFIVRKRFVTSYRENVQSAASQLQTQEKRFLEKFPDPILLLSSEAHVISWNEAFAKITNNEDFFGRHIDDLGMGLEGENGRIGWESVAKSIRYNGRDYIATMRKLRIEDAVSTGLSEDDASKMYAVAFRDVTDEKRLQKENDERQPVIALIYIDNYEQVMESMDETRKPVLEAMIYRAVSNLSQSVNGLLVRLEKDRFQLSFHNVSLPQIEEGRFKLLEEVKHLNYGNKFAPTLSIGVGMAPMLQDARDLAREAVELALGRGGDQAVVKTPERQNIYGGTTDAAETVSRVRARHVANVLSELAEDASRVLIMGHTNPDLDCLGASLGLAAAMRELRHPVNIVLGENHPAVAELYARIAAEPSCNGILIGPAQAERFAEDENCLLILVDVNRSAFVEAPVLLEKAACIALIDHHRTAEDTVENPELRYVEPFASSASEMVAEIIQYMTERLKLKQVEADGLFAGIALDTKNFTVKTGVRSFEAAAYLRRQGADGLRVREMFKNNIDEYRAKASVVSSARIVYKNIAVAKWTAYGDNAQTVAAQAADELLDVMGIESSFVLSDIEGVIFISARSLGKINVQLIMESLGGGGHLNGAGAQLRDLTLDEAEGVLLAAIEAYLAKK